MGPVGLGTAVTPLEPGDMPAPLVRLCRHCLTVIEGRVLATYNRAPLCVGNGDDRPNCYRMVSMFNHEMPCLGDPCPGEVVMEHDHGGGEHGQGEGHPEQGDEEGH